MPCFNISIRIITCRTRCRFRSLFNCPCFHSFLSRSSVQVHLANPARFPFHRGMGGLDMPIKSGTANINFLPQDSGNLSPACLDGSPYAFYFQKSTTNSTKWTISIEGGGWCYDEGSCYSRASTPLGSSTTWAATSGCGCMNVLPNGGGIDNNCNCIYMPYWLLWMFSFVMIVRVTSPRARV